MTVCDPMPIPMHLFATLPHRSTSVMLLKANDDADCSDVALDLDSLPTEYQGHSMLRIFAPLAFR